MDSSTAPVVYEPQVPIAAFIPAFPGHDNHQKLLGITTAPVCGVGVGLAVEGLTGIPYVPGYSGHTSGPIGTVLRIVWHATVSPCARGQARAVARYFAMAAAGGLAHYVVDPGERVQCAPESLATWGAPPNHGEIHIELCDPQTGPASRWQDPDHQSMLRLAAELAADIGARHGLPVVHIGPAQLLAGIKGHTEHVDVSNTWHETDHQDPQQSGPFPTAQLMAMIAGVGAPPATPVNPDMAVTGDIGFRFRALGGSAGFLGAPVGVEVDNPNGYGRRHDFTRGKIYWSYGTGAHEVHGDIMLEYGAVGWEQGKLGLPVTDETPCAFGDGRFNFFEHGGIWWTYATKAHAVVGDIYAAYTAAKFETTWGYPVGDEQDCPGGRSQQFEKGTATWNATSRQVAFA